MRIVLFFSIVASAGCGSLLRDTTDSGTDATIDVVADNTVDTSVDGCSGSQLACGAVCVDPQTDPTHCGACITQCGAPDGGVAICSAGACAFACGGGLSTCESACVDEANDPLHCGACNIACDGGACCNGNCVDTSTDKNNCQSCGLMCDGGSCLDASCVYGSYTLGYPQVFSLTSSFTKNFLDGEPITVPSAATLTAFGLITTGTASHVMMALYTDKSGAPDQLVASTSATSVTGNDQQIAASQTSLSPGTYWIIGIYDVDTLVFVDSNPSTKIAYSGYGFGNPFPTTFPSPTLATSPPGNYYITVQ